MLVIFTLPVWEKLSLSASCLSFVTEEHLGEGVFTRAPFSPFMLGERRIAFPIHTHIQLLLTRLESSPPHFFFTCFHNVFIFCKPTASKMIKEKRRCLKKAAKYQRKAESIQRRMGCAVWCIVRYINLPPTLCRSKQTPRLLLAVSPRQYFYLSCETAIQIDEVQQHDIFCTSITLRGWATWVKSQQTITFPDISSPHSDR